MSQFRIRRQLPSLLVGLALLTGACGSASTSPAASGAPGSTSDASASAGTPKMGGSITVVVDGEPASMDPAFAYDFVTGFAVDSVTEPLLKLYDGDQKVGPNLAELWTVSPDGLTVTLKIRQGVKFHDGSTMSVDDVVYSLDRIRDPKVGSYVSWMLADVTDVSAPDASTVVLKLSQPDAMLPYALATTAGHVVSKKFVEANGDKYGKPDVGSIGTGPFKFVDWVSGDHQTLARFDDYWNKASGGPYLDKVTIKILPEPSTRVAGLQTGDIDYIVNSIPSDQWSAVKAMQDVTLTLAPSYDSEFISMNTKKAPLDNPQVRQAINYAFNKAAVRELFYGTDSLPTKDTLVTPQLWTTATTDQQAWQTAWDQVPAYDYDLAKAKQMLAATGAAAALNGMDIIYWDSTPSIKGAGEAFVDAMAQLGVTITPRKMTYQDAITHIYGKHDDYDFLVTNWASDFPDPSGQIVPVFNSANSGDGGANSSSYSNPAVDALLNQQGTLLDNTARTKLLVQAQQQIAEDSPMIVTAYPAWPIATNNRIAGVSVGATWWWDDLFKDVYVK